MAAGPATGYFPKEFTVMVTVVYIPPGANANVALGFLHGSISVKQSAKPDVVHIVARDFRSGDRSLYSTAQANLKKGIREAKVDCRRRVEEHLNSNNHRQVAECPASYQTSAGSAEGDASLAEELNFFFAHFEVDRPKSAIQYQAARRSFTFSMR